MANSASLCLAYLRKDRRREDAAQSTHRFEAQKAQKGPSVAR